MLRVAFLYSLALLIFSPVVTAWQKPSSRPRVLTATAFLDSGVTVKGNSTKPGTAAADSSVIPLGSKVRVTGAGAYSGNYTVTDTGNKVVGRMIDLFIPSAAEAKVFGRKRVRVQILTVGDNVKNQPETSAKVPKSQLAPAEKAQVALPQK